MAKVLSGLELQGFIKQRQLRQVRNLIQAHHITPRLLIVMSDQANDVIDAYVRLKSHYAEDIGIRVDIEKVPQSEMPDVIESANNDPSVQGIIVQLPLQDATQTQQICNLIAPEKDVDGLGSDAAYPSATAHAIDWLLAGYGVELEGKHIAVVGNGKLVGAPLVTMWQSRGFDVTVLDEHSTDTHDVLQASDIIVSATGVPRVIKSEDVKRDAIVVDAGTASENGVIVGDVDDAVRERSDVSMTPKKGGVGPLTYTVLFDHLIEACLTQAKLL